MADTRSQRTRMRILDAAERLFAEYGHDNTTMRQITDAAQVNLSSVNYHFGSKDALIECVFQRRLDALNHERLLLLDTLELQYRDRLLPPSAVLDAYFGPLVRHACSAGVEGRAFLPLQTATMSDPHGAISALFAAERTVVAQRFTRALLTALPQVPEGEIAWRFHFMLGATAHALMVAQSSARIMPQGGHAQASANDLLGHLMPFLLGGLCAPWPTNPYADHTP